MKSLFIFSILLISCFSTAESLNTNLSAQSQVDLQKIIDSIYFDIITRLPEKDRCQIFSSKYNLTYDLGVSLAVAHQLLNHCPQKEGQLTRYFKKKYFLIKDDDQKLDSWTNFQNETSIYIHDHFDVQSLYLTLLHEFAMTYDAKSFLYYLQYLKWNESQKPRFLQRKITERDFRFSNQDNQLRNRFNKALWSPVRYTFAAMRAFAFEESNLNKTFLVPRHAICVRQFRAIFPQLAKIKDQVNTSQNSITQLIDLFSQVSDDSVGPSSDEEADDIIRDILSDERNLQQDGTKLTFCQYMSVPKLTANSYDLSLANGPRPRLTNPNNGQGGASTQFSAYANHHVINQWQQNNEFKNFDQMLQTIKRNDMIHSQKIRTDQDSQQDFQK